MTTPIFIDLNQRQRLAIYSAIGNERDYQDRKYGTPGERKLTVGNYLQIARQELNEAQAAAADGDLANALLELLQVAAVAVACIERHGLVERPTSSLLPVLPAGRDGEG